ncbi:MAG: hypothetical protein KDE53_33415 [Caldilineaceae bacterium]|nr:hypothetical protein [Caldilineaceae bacterium]
MSIEQLQAVRHGRLYESLLPAIENSLDTLNCSDDEQVLVSFALESFLFEARSFLDVYMVFVCLLLRTGFTNGHMSQSVFYGELHKVEESPFAHKAQWINEYFDNNVFGYEENPDEKHFRKDWGALVKSLRDRIAHRDVISLSFDSEERYANDIRLDWPTLKGFTYHSISEMVGNGIHSLFRLGLCHIYELTWDGYLLVAQKAT